MRKLLFFFIGVIIVYKFTNAFVIDGGVVVGDSMEPTFVPGAGYTKENKVFISEYVIWCKKRTYQNR